MYVKKRKVKNLLSAQVCYLVMFVALVMVLTMNVAPTQAAFAPPPMDQHYYSQSLNQGYEPNPTYGYDFDSGYLGTGNNWSEASAGGLTLKGQYHVSDTTNAYGGLQTAEGGSSEFMQQFVATGNTQTFNLAWNGAMSANANIELIYELNWHYAVYDSDVDEWLWQGGPFGEELDNETLIGGSLNINETATKSYDFEPGALFAIWIYQSTGSGWYDMTPNVSVTADADFYNSFAITGVSGAEAVPIPRAVWLLGSGLVGLVVVRRRR